LRPRLGEIQKQLEDVELKLRAYRDAPAGKSKEALAALEKSLAALNERRRELEAQLRPA
jgi:chromosome segregation ATPase